jgi:sugar transferase (PEP-CTERM/EpsH1 system associated)
MSLAADYVASTVRHRASKCEPIRVVHVVPNLCTGGMERLVLEMLEHSNPERASPQVLCIGQRGQYAADAEELGVAVTALHAPIRRNLRLPFKLARFLRHTRTEVVHTHGPYAQFYGAVAARMAGCPVIHTMHGFPWPRTWRRRLLGRLSNSLTRSIVAVSHDLSDYALGELQVPAERLHVIHNGIECDRFSLARREAGSRRFDAIMVARLSSEKDFPSLLQAVGLVQQKRPDFRLAIAGDGPLRQEVEDLIEQLRLEQHVELLGNRSDVPSLLTQAEVFVLSTHTEGLSIALLEAMACGKPIVATAVGGNPEVVVDGETGFLVPRDAPQVLASRLLWLTEHPEEARRMGAAGRRRVEQQFNIRRMVESYEDLYCQAAGRKGHDKLLP